VLNEPTENEYVDDSGDDLEEMREDEELAYRYCEFCIWARVR